MKQYTLESGKTLYLRKMKGRDKLAIISKFSPFLSLYGTYVDLSQGEGREVLFSSLAKCVEHSLNEDPTLIVDTYDILAKSLCNESGKVYKDEGLELIQELIDDEDAILDVLIWMIENQMFGLFKKVIKARTGLSDEDLTEAFNKLKSTGEEGQ